MPIVLLFALMCGIGLFVAWWTFSSILSITLGQLIVFAAVGGICYALGRAHS